MVFPMMLVIVFVVNPNAMVMIPAKKINDPDSVFFSWNSIASTRSRISISISIFFNHFYYFFFLDGVFFAHAFVCHCFFQLNLYILDMICMITTTDTIKVISPTKASTATSVI